MLRSDVVKASVSSQYSLSLWYSVLQTISHSINQSLYMYQSIFLKCLNSKDFHLFHVEC